MAFLNLNRLGFGKSATPANNIVARTPDIPDGSLIVSKGTYDAPGATLATFNADGSVSPAAVLASTENSQKAATTAWAKLGFVVLLAASGYIKLPSWLGGVIFQWGSVNTSAANTFANWTFPLAFPTACVLLLAQTRNSGGSAFYSCTGVASTTAGEVSCTFSGAATSSVFAIGY